MLSESMDHKMTDIYDFIHDPVVMERNIEEIYDYPTDVGSDEKIVARRVEMTSNPAYGPSTTRKSKS